MAGSLEFSVLDGRKGRTYFPNKQVTIRKCFESHTTLQHLGTFFQIMNLVVYMRSKQLKHEENVGH